MLSSLSDLVEELDSDKNPSDLDPSSIRSRSHVKLWWRCKSCRYSWQATPDKRVSGRGCPDCAGKVVRPLSYYPCIADDFHPLKNQPGLLPTAIVANSEQKYWWLCGHCEHEWETSARTRYKGRGCPKCGGVMRRKLSEFPDLVAQLHFDNYQDHPDLLKLPMSSKVRLLWVCPDCDREWRTSVGARTKSQPTGCPSCAAKKRARSPDRKTPYRPLSKVPELVVELHKTLNPPETLDLEEISKHTDLLLWWTCSECNHDWQTSVTSRFSGRGCPLCGDKRGTKKRRAKQLEKVGPFGEHYPDVLKEWDHDKNDTDPASLTAGSHYLAWWRCKYGHEWQTQVKTRTVSGSGCRFCNSHGTSRIEIRVYSELLLLFPESQWRYKVEDVEADIFVSSKNLVIELDGYPWHNNETKYASDVSKQQIWFEAGYQIIRLRDYRLVRTLSHSISVKLEITDEFSVVTTLIDELGERNLLEPEKLSEWRQSIQGSRFPNEDVFQEILRRTPMPDFDNSLAGQYPEISKTWSKKNGKLKPEMFRPKSGQVVWWVCSGCQKEYKVAISKRTLTQGCAACGQIAGVKQRQRGLLKTRKSLQERMPDLAAEWVTTLNGDLTPSQVTCGSNLKVWWECKNKHTYKAIIGNRTKGSGCPECNKKPVVNLDTDQEYSSITEAAAAVGITRTTIGDMLRGKIRTAGGYRWRFK